jgi:hypothetical protein
MAKVVGVLKQASAPTLTPTGQKSEARAVDPQDTVVQVEGNFNPQLVKHAVRNYVKALADKKGAEERAAEQAEVLRAYAGELRAANAVAGDYQKTYRVVGERLNKEQFLVDVSQSDRWTPVKGVDLKKLRADKGAVLFDAVVEEETTISIKDEILKNRTLRIELSKALEAALGVEGIKKYFKKETVFVVKEGTDKKQYTLPAPEKGVLEAGFKQVSDSVKDATVKVD